MSFNLSPADVLRLSSLGVAAEAEPPAPFVVGPVQFDCLARHFTEQGEKLANVTRERDALLIALKLLQR